MYSTSDRWKASFVGPRPLSGASHISWRLSSGRSIQRKEFEKNKQNQEKADPGGRTIRSVEHRNRKLHKQQEGINWRRKEKRLRKRQGKGGQYCNRNRRSSTGWRYHKSKMDQKHTQNKQQYHRIPELTKLNDLFEMNPKVPHYDQAELEVAASLDRAERNSTPHFHC